MVVFCEEWALGQGLEEALRVDPDKDCRAIRDLGGEGGHAAAKRRELRAGPICGGWGLGWGEVQEAGGRGDIVWLFRVEHSAVCPHLGAEGSMLDVDGLPRGLIQCGPELQTLLSTLLRQGLWGSCTASGKMKTCGIAAAWCGGSSAMCQKR